MKDIKFRKLNKKHRWLFIGYYLGVFFGLILMIFAGVKHTNPVLYTSGERIQVGLGVIVGGLVFISTFFNRAKELFKVNFVKFLIILILAAAFKAIIDTVIWTVGLSLIILAADDLILKPLWRLTWEKHYDGKD